MNKMLTLLFSLTMNLSQAQAIPGEYYLQNVMETGSGFRLNADSSFQFFFSYGALDRTAEGNWTREGDSVIFQTRKRPLHDYALRNSKKTKDEFITVHLKGSASMGPYLHCTIKGDGKKQEGTFRGDESALFKPQPVSSIELTFEFCPEKTSVFYIGASDHNYFEFEFEPWMMELFFERFTLKRTSEGFTGKHPLLNGEEFVYRKSGNE
jgi:hypothetical protein